MRMVLAQAVADGRLAKNPADYAKLKNERGNAAVVDNPEGVLTSQQVSTLPSRGRQ
jgi:hypothetical protein